MRVFAKTVSRFVVVRNPPPETRNVPVEVTSLVIGRDHSWLRLKPSSSQPVIPPSISFMGRPPGSAHQTADRYQDGAA